MGVCAMGVCVMGVCVMGVCVMGEIWEYMCEQEYDDVKSMCVCVCVCAKS